MRTLIVLLLVTLGCLATASSQTVLKSDTKGAQVRAISYFRTTDPRVDILNVGHQTFKDLDSTRNVSLGFDRATHWFRFQLTNHSKSSQWYLNVAYAPTDHVEFYYKDLSGNWKLQFSGDLYPVSQRPLRHRHYVFPFSIPKESTETYYLKVESKSSIQLPLSVWTEEGLRDQTYDEQFGHGIFYGIMLIMIFYNLFLYISVRDKTILLYVFTLLTGTNVIAFFQGYGFFLLYPELPQLNEFFAAFSAPLFIVASVEMTRQFLLLRQFSFKLDRLLLAVSIATAVTAVLTIGFGEFISYKPLHILTIINFALILYSAIYCFKQKFRPARYFLLAWVSILLVGVFFSLRNIGAVQGNWFTNNALYFGGVMQTLLISFALGDRINMLLKENQMARERELQREQEEKERLEKEVLQRTEEIRLKNSQLEESNSIKDKLFSIVSHDLKGPLNSLKGILNIVDTGSLTSDELKMLTRRIGEQLHLTTDFLENLLQWSRMQMKGESFMPLPSAFPVRKLLIESTDVLRTEFEKKNIRLEINAPVELNGYADISMIQTVVRNLTSNALKFTSAGGMVAIDAALNGNLITIKVSDTGVGIPEEHLFKIFTLQSVTTAGTREEKGTGIGLVVCKEFVERNGGTIKATSRTNIGSIFEFTVPAFA